MTPGYRISADGSQVVYMADAFLNNVRELFSVAIDGAASARRVSGEMVPGGFVRAFDLSADGTRATYLADQDVDNQFELYLGKVVPVRDSSRTSPPGTTVVRGL